MRYVIIPRGGYTYSPIILSSLLCCNAGHYQEGGPEDRELTIFLQLQDSHDGLYFFKDVRFGDPDFDEDRMRRLIRNMDHLEPHLPMQMVASTIPRDYEGRMSNEPVYENRYTVFYHNEPNMQVNLLVFNEDLPSFLDRSVERSRQHGQDPLLYLDLRLQFRGSRRPREELAMFQSDLERYEVRHAILHERDLRMVQGCTPVRSSVPADGDNSFLRIEWGEGNHGRQNRESESNQTRLPFRETD